MHCLTKRNFTMSEPMFPQRGIASPRVAKVYASLHYTSHARELLQLKIMKLSVWNSFIHYNHTSTITLTTSTSQNHMFNNGRHLIRLICLRSTFRFLSF